MSNAYVVGHITIKDPDKWAQYRDRVPASLQPWNAELVLRGELVSVLSGQHGHTDTVVICFPDLDAANGWFNSPAYQALIPLRQSAAEVDLLLFQG